MVTRRKDESELSGDDNLPRRPPATTPELREQELVAVAYDLVENRLRNGTASAQETVHFLKMGTAKERLERMKLERELTMTDAKIEQMTRADRIEELFENAINAFRGYSGEVIPSDDEQQ